MHLNLYVSGKINPKQNNRIFKFEKFSKYLIENNILKITKYKYY